MLLLTLPLALSSLGFLSNSTTLLSKIESSPAFETAWNANLDLAVAMSKDPKIAEVLSPTDWKMLKDVALNLDMCKSFNRPNVSKWTILKDVRVFLEKNVSPLVLITVLEKLVSITSVQTIIKEYPEHKIALNLIQVLAVKITEDFGPDDMTPEVWKQLLIVTRMEIDQNITRNCEDIIIKNCTEVCDKEGGKTAKYLDLANTDEEELSRLFLPLVPTTAETALDSLHIGFLLRLPLLINTSALILEKAVSVENAVKIYQLAIKTKNQDLKKKAEDFIWQDFDQLSKNDKNFVSLEVDELFSLLVSDKLFVKEEYSVFDAIVRWVQTDVTSRKNHVSTLMKSLRLHLLSLSQLKSMLEHLLLAELESVLESVRAVILLIETDSKELPGLVEKERRHQHETLFVIGGRVMNSPRNINIETLSTHQDKWIYHPRFNNVTASSESVLAVGKTVLVFNLDGTYHSRVTSFDPVKKEWKLLSELPSFRMYFAVAELHGLVYTLGGTSTTGVRSGTCNRYNPETDKWSTLPILNKARSFAGASSLQGKIYVVGGIENSDAALNSVEVFDPDTHRWTFVTPMRTARDSFPLVADEKYLWAFGGSTNSVERYDPQKNTWSDMPAMKIALHSHSAVLFSGEFYVIGGNIYEARVNVYDPSTGTWREAPSLNIGRHFFGACVIANLPNAEEFLKPE